MPRNKGITNIQEIKTLRPLQHGKAFYLSKGERKLIRIKQNIQLCCLFCYSGFALQLSC